MKPPNAYNLLPTTLHCIILVLEALALSAQSFAKSRAGAVFAGISTPSYNMPVAKAECLRLLECQVREFCRHWDDCDVIVDSENRQVAYDGAWCSRLGKA